MIAIRCDMCGVEVSRTWIEIVPGTVHFVNGSPVERNLHLCWECGSLSDSSELVREKIWGHR